MKTKHRLDYNRLAEALGERGLIAPDSLQHVLHQCLGSRVLFPEVLVSENLISDWEIARVVSEVFGLPFLTPQVYSPSPKALEGMKKEFLHQHDLVPLDRFGKLMTLAMPALTPSEIIGGFGREYGVEVIPVVSTVLSNRHWLYENMPIAQAPAPAAPPAAAADENAMPDLDDVQSALPQNIEDLGDDWANLFDEGDAAVLLDLDPSASDVDEPGPPLGEDLPELPKL